MAQVEPMDIDAIESDFDNKENAFHHNNLQSRTPCTEKGYEELDVSELNMKLRYSITPASSPMTKSLTGPSLDNRTCNTEDYLSAVGTDNNNLTRSLNSSLNKSDGFNKSKVLPLQTLSSDPFVDSNRNLSIRRLLDPADSNELSSANDIEENLSVPSTCSSMPETPEAVTPTKEIPKPEGSPIMRGLKSVLSMFRPSQSPIAPTDDKLTKQENLNPVEFDRSGVEVVQISTPMSSKQREGSLSKRTSPLKESLVFNDDLEKELQWKDDSSIIFKGERVPVHKLFFSNPITETKCVAEPVNTTIEYMDISCNESALEDKSKVTLNVQDRKEDIPIAVESDNEFLDCETTFSKNDSDMTNTNQQEKVSEMYTTENKIVAVSCNDATSQEIEAGNKTAVNNTNCEEPCNISVKLDLESVPVTDFNTKEVGNITNVIEKTSYLLNEQIDNPNTIFNLQCELQQQSQVNTVQLQETTTNKRVDIDNHVVKEEKTDVTESKDSLQTSAINIVSPCKNQEDTRHNIIHNVTLQEINKSNDNLLSVYSEETLGIENIQETNNEISNIKENTNIKENNKESICLEDNCPLENNCENVKSIHTDGSLPIVEQPSVANIISINEELKLHNDALNSDVTVTDAIDNLVSSSFSENHHSNNAISIMNKTHEDLPKFENENVMPPNNFVYSINSSNTHTVLNVADIGSGSKLQNTSMNNNLNYSDVENIKVEKSNSLQRSLIENLKSEEVLTYNNNDREISEFTLGSEVVSTNVLPELPLQIEHSSSTSSLNEIDSNKQDNSQILTVSVNSEMIQHSEHATSILKPVTEMMENTHIKDLNVNEVLVEEDANMTQTVSTQSAHIYINEETVIVKNDDRIEICTSLKAQHNSLPEDKSFGTSMLNNIDVDHDIPEINFSSPADKIDNVPTDADEISFPIKSDSINASKPCESNDLEQTKEQIIYDQKIDEVDAINCTVDMKVDEIDEEIITSANNSPYVSVTDLAVDVDKIMTNLLQESNNPISTNSASPPLSPKIVSKGYNFNFDDIDDPFATKTKIRMSPSPDGPNQSFDMSAKDIKRNKNNSRRKSQPEKKRSIQKNTSLTYTLKNKDSTLDKNIDSVNITSNDVVLDNISSSPDNITESKLENLEKNIPQTDINDDNVKSGEFDLIDTQNDPVETKNPEQTLVISTEKSTSSSEQYFSLGASLGDGDRIDKSKNVFNLPEIDDANFNPFATKSKMRSSPSPMEKSKELLKNTSEIANPSVSPKQSHTNENKSNQDSDLTFNKNITEDFAPDVSSATCSSKNTNDIDSTVKEILTEDEDTIEGPFLDIEDCKDTEKLCDVGGTGIINFDKAPKLEKDENVDSGEIFIDADAFEFLLNQNKSTTVLDSGKESLFLKFDPLFAKRVSSDGILAALSKVQERQSTPKKVAKPPQRGLASGDNPVAGPSSNEMFGLMEEFNDDTSTNVTKPMMIVTPAISSNITQKKFATPTLNRRSLTCTSPAMAVIDRLLSLSGNTSHLENDTSIPQIDRANTETSLAITQLRELLAEKEINVHNLRSESKELKVRLAALENKVRSLESESAERLTKINELSERLLEKTKMNKSMATVVEEYERTIASLISETEQEKKRNAEEKIRLIKERDEQTAHLTSMEVSFSDLHSKYEKSKQIILKCKANEDICRKSIQEFQDNFTKMQNNYELLKQHATSKLNHANQELEKMNRAHEAEVLKMNALIKRKELHITSLEETLAQKSKANEELTAICDELINKVG